MEKFLKVKSYFDHEDGQEVSWNRLQVSFRIDSTVYYMFIPVDSFDQEGMRSSVEDKTVQVKYFMNDTYVYILGVSEFELN